MEQAEFGWRQGMMHENCVMLYGVVGSSQALRPYQEQQWQVAFKPCNGLWGGAIQVFSGGLDAELFSLLSVAEMRDEVVCVGGWYVINCGPHPGRISVSPYDTMECGLSHWGGGIAIHQVIPEGSLVSSAVFTSPFLFGVTAPPL